MARHVMTARRKAALRKAQLASARKRRSRRRKIAASVIGTGILGATIYGVKNRHRIGYVALTAKNFRSREKAAPGAFFKRSPKNNYEKYLWAATRQKLRRKMKSTAITNQNVQSSRRANKAAVRRRKAMKAV